MNDSTNTDLFVFLLSEMIWQAFTDVSQKNFNEFFNLYRVSKVKATIRY